MKRVVVWRPESTGKTSLSEYLGNYFNGIFVPEYAREYIGKLERAYNDKDIIAIAKKQLEQHSLSYQNTESLVFYDTGLIITKIWFLEVFGKYPLWIDLAIKKYKPELYLLCYFDLPWEFDLFRENGSDERREYLFQKYLEEIKKTGSKYQIIKGFKEERFKLAIETIENKIFNDVKK